MRAERFGSYSMDATLAGMSRLSRLKSITRHWRRLPPPRCRTVMRPWVLRPPDFRSDTFSARTGLVVVISSKVAPVMPRRPGDVGLNFFTATVI